MHSDPTFSVTYVRPGKEKNTLTLGIRTEAGVVSYTVGERLYAEIGAPRTEDSIDEDTLLLLKEEQTRREAMKIALRLLAFADNSERALTDKLRRRAIPREIAEQTVRETVRLGYLNEERALRTLILSAANHKLYGPVRIRAALAAKGYPQAKVSRVLNALCEGGEIDFDENLSRLLSEKAGDAPSAEEIQKYKVQYGYRSC